MKSFAATGPEEIAKGHALHIKTFLNGFEVGPRRWNNMRDRAHLPEQTPRESAHIALAEVAATDAIRGAFDSAPELEWTLQALGHRGTDCRLSMTHSSFWTSNARSCLFRSLANSPTYNHKHQRDCKKREIGRELIQAARHDVMNAEDMMIDEPFDQVEAAPSNDRVDRWARRANTPLPGTAWRPRR